MTVNLYRENKSDDAAFLSRLADAQHAISHVRLPFKSHFSFDGFRCRARVLGNSERFAIALSVFIGRVPFSAENRPLRNAFLGMGGQMIADNAATLEIKSDNWAIASVRYCVSAEPTRANLTTSLCTKLMQLHPAVTAMDAALITD